MSPSTSCGYKNTPTSLAGVPTSYLTAEALTNWNQRKITIHLAQAPTRKVIAQTFQAMHNSTFTNPPITRKSFNCTMQAWEEKFDKKTCHDGIYNQIQCGQMHGGNNRHTQNSNRKHCYDNGSNGYGVPTLKPTPTSYSAIFGCHPSKLPTHNHSTNHLPMHNEGTLPQLQVPLGFHNPPPTNIKHQGYNIYH